MRRFILLLIIFALAGCNLETTASLTLTPSVSSTPLILPSPTSPEVLVTPIPVPAQTEVEQPAPQNIIQAFVNNVVMPILNFLFTFVTDAVVSLWSLAGVRGGGFGQALCCIIPGGGVGLVLLARLRLLRRG